MRGGGTFPVEVGVVLPIKNSKFNIAFGRMVGYVIPTTVVSLTQVVAPVFVPLLGQMVLVEDGFVLLPKDISIKTAIGMTEVDCAIPKDSASLISAAYQIVGTGAIQKLAIMPIPGVFVMLIDLRILTTMNMQELLLMIVLKAVLLTNLRLFPPPPLI